MKAEEIIKIAMLKMHISSVKELAERIGIEPATLRYNLKNPKSMSIGRLRAIAEIINLSPEELTKIIMTTPRG